MNDDQVAVQNFNGVAKLFPLPGLVFFPQAVQPLHIFEPRYRQMTADALNDDQLVALVLLQPDWEKNYDQNPAIHPVACLGRIIGDQLLPDGRYNLMLRGLVRVRIDEEVLSARLYRQARVTIQEDQVPDSVPELMRLRAALAELVLPRFSNQPAREQIQALFKGELPLGQLCDVLTFALPLPPETKQLLLETTHVVARAEQLMSSFEAVVAKATPTKKTNKFPPDFSLN
jgi:Lon protease-like protein